MTGAPTWRHDPTLAHQPAQLVYDRRPCRHQPLADAVQRMQDYPERVVLPGIAISLTVLSVNYLGDGLRDAADPYG